MAEFNNNRNKKRFEKVENVEQPELNESENEIVNEEPKPELKIGVVTECVRLNVREAPAANADVVCILDFATEVEVDLEESTEDFYKVITATSAEGYCMKEFIAI